MNIEFDCAHCGQHLAIDESFAGQPVKCPACEKLTTAPAAEPTAAETVLSEKIFCPKCGQENLENSFKCIGCGFVLHGPPTPKFVVDDDNTMGGLIPYRNPKALWAYYLGLLALLPVLGLPIGIASLTLGMQGAKFANLNPEAKGKYHAWTGIVLGTLSLVGHVALYVLLGDFS
jgi:phage FluMu protein Com